MATPFEVRVLRAASGNQYVEVRKDAACVVVPYPVFGNAAKAAQRLACAGILVDSKNDRKALWDGIQASDVESAAIVAEAPGWNGSCFVLGSGEVLHQPTGKEVVVAFDAEGHLFSRVGSFTCWRKNVAAKLNGQSASMLVIMACLLPALRPYMLLFESFALEVVDPGGTDLAFITQLAAGVTGGTGLTTAASFAVPLSALMHDPRAVAARRRDHALVLDGVDAYMGIATARERSRVHNTLAHQLPLWGRRGKDLGVKTVAILTASDSVRAASKSQSGGNDALITLDLSAGDRQGAVGQPPESRQRRPESSYHLCRAILIEDGTAFRRLVERLPDPSSQNASEVKQWLANAQAEFVAAAKQRSGAVQATKAMKAFAACFAAGRYAQRRGVLPKQWNCLAAVLDCLDRHHSSARSGPPIAQQLQQVIAAGAVLTISDGADPAAQQPRAKLLGATLWETPAGREVRMTNEATQQLFTGWPAVLDGADARAILLAGDGRHRQRKAVLAPGLKRSRLFCFRLPAADEPLGAFPAKAPRTPRAEKRKCTEYLEIVSAPRRPR